MIVRELVTRLGFDADEKALRDYERGMRDLRRTAQLVVTAAGAAGAALVGMGHSSARAGDEIAKTAERIGVGITALQEYRFAARRSGVESRTLDMALQRFGRRVGEAAKGTGEAKDTLAEMNIELRDANGLVRSTEELLPQVADYLSRIEDENRRNALAFKLFDSEGVAVVQMLEEGAAGLQRYAERAHDLNFVMSVEQVRASERYMDSLADLRAALTGLRNLVGAELLPQMIEVTEATVEWFLANRELIRQRLQTFVQSLTSFLRQLWRMISAVARVMNTMAEAAGGWGNVLELVVTTLGVLIGARFIRGLWSLARALRGVSGALGLLATVMRRIPIFWIALGIAALIQDIKAWVEGNKSAIGEVLGEWEDFKQRIQGLIDSIVAKWEGFTQKVRDMMDTLIERWEQFKALVEEVLGLLPSVGGRNARVINVPGVSRRRWADERGVIGADDPPAPRPGPPPSVLRTLNEMVEGMIAPPTPAPVGAVRRGTAVFNVSTNVTVPPGTPEEQQRAIGETVRDQVRREIQREYDLAAGEFAGG